MLLFIALAAVVSANIVNLEQLYKAIEAGPNRKFGYIAQANKDQVVAILPSSTEWVEEPNQETLFELIANGTLIGGTLASHPSEEQSKGLNVIPSRLLAPKTMFVANDPARHEDLLDAIDAVLVNLQHVGSDVELAIGLDVEISVIQTCKNPEIFPFPDAVNATGDLRQALDTGKLIMGGLSGGDDAVYIDNVTGQLADAASWFQEGDWVYEYSMLVSKALEAQYSFTVEHVYFDSSGNLFEQIENGAVHLSEPYYFLDSVHPLTGASRKRDQKTSCITYGTEPVFLSQNTDLIKDETKVELSTGAQAAIGIGSALLFFLCVFLAYLIRREKQGRAMFHALPAAETEGAAMDKI